MYESFFGLNEKPFSLLPDPSFFYLSKMHREALTLVEYGLYNQTGFTVLTGEIGSGKTTLMRYLLGKLDDELTVGLISHTHESIGQIMDWVCVAFELNAPAGNKIQQHQALEAFLIEQYRRGKRTLLIIDEAQNLGIDKLEEIRLLSNINADKDLVLQLLLLGQPQLREQLRSPQLEQFVQRVSASYHLGRLSAEETFYYIRHRLKVAGGRREIFTPDACHAAFHYSGGIPRIINLICETALVFSYGAGERRITGEAIDGFVKSDASNLLLAINREERQPEPALTARLAASAPPMDAESEDGSDEPAAAEGAVAAQEAATGGQTPRADAASRPESAGGHLGAEDPATSPAAPAKASGSTRPHEPEGDLSLAELIRPARFGGRRVKEIAAVAAGVALGIGLMGWYLSDDGGAASTPSPQKHTSRLQADAMRSGADAPSNSAASTTGAIPAANAANQGLRAQEVSSTTHPLPPVDRTQASAVVPSVSADSPVDPSLPGQAPDTPAAPSVATNPAPESIAEPQPPEPQDEHEPAAAQAKTDEAAAIAETVPSEPEQPRSTSVSAVKQPGVLAEPGPGTAQNDSVAAPLDALTRQLRDLSLSVSRPDPKTLEADCGRLVQFEDGTTELDAKAKDVLAKLSDILKEKDVNRTRIIVTAHTDSKGSRQANAVLSERRAKNVAAFLVAQGIDQGRISYQGKGEEEFKVSAAQEKAMGPWVNRRVELTILETD